MLALTLGLVAALGWGTHDLMVRKLAPGAEELPLLTFVVTMAALVVLPFGLVFGDWSRVTGAALIWAGGAGVSYCLASLALYAAFARAPARLVAPIIGAYPLVSLGFDSWGQGALPSAAWVAAGLIVAGIAIVASAGGAEADRRHPAALPLAGLACLGMATAFALGQEATRLTDPALGATLTRCACALTALILLALRPRGTAHALAQWRRLGVMGTLDGTALTAVVAAGALPFAVYASVVSSLFGVVTILLAWAFLGERVRPWQGLGIALIFLGLARLAAS